MSIRVSNLALRVIILLAGTSLPAFSITIDFENLCPSGQQPSGPCSALFSTAGNAETLTVSTSIGNVSIQGGALFDAIANLPSDETAVYGTAGNAANIGVFPGSGFTNPITITFPQPITGLSIDVLNGNTMPVDYHLADNAGNMADFLLAPNLSAGQKTIGLATTGSVVTIGAVTGQNTPFGMTWDFLIDNINFTTQASTNTPEPGSALLIGLGLIAFGLAGRGFKSRRRTVVLLSAGSLPGLFVLAASCNAATVSGPLTPPVLRLSDAFGDSVSIDATGAAACTGYCNTTVASASGGSIGWEGTLGMFTIEVAGGQSKPALPGSAINLGLRVTTGPVGAGGASSSVLTALWSDVRFSGTGPATMTSSFALAGNVTLLQKGYVDNSNALFGTGTPVGTLGPATSGSSTSIVGPGPASGLFSMTEMVTVTMGGNSSFTLSTLNLMAGPPLPLSLGCPTASGQLSVPYDSYLTPSGGVPPYAFSSTGSLPSGLAINPSTGEISGIPAIAGGYTFTAQVTDTSGNTGQNPIQTSCNISIAAAASPLALACPDPGDVEGEAYSSSLVATGGTPPYSFFITSGLLPPGLSLNPSTGSITGTNNTVTGSYPFTVKVTGSGNGAANQALNNCLVLAAAPSYKMAAAPNTTPQTVVVNSALSNPLAVIVTDSKTNKPVKGVTVTFTVVIAPKNIPSGTFTGGENNELNTLNSIDVDTNAQGIATAPKFIANTVTGNYTVTARATGAPNVLFKLTNTAGPPFKIAVTGGDKQSKQILTAFNVLTAAVTDQFGNPVPNYPVLFSAPATPAAPAPPVPSATFGKAGATTATVTTDQNGVATSPGVTANGKAGSYFILATVVQLPLQPQVPPAIFSMTNVAGPPARLYRIVPTKDPTYVGGVFFATVNTTFSPLTVEVTDAGDNPLSGLEVRFRSSVAPADPGGDFKGPNSNLGLFCKLKTGANGRATADPLTANRIVGAWSVGVTVTGTTLSNRFKMQNVGTVAVPNVVGMTQAAATAAITGAKLNVGKVTMQSSKTVAKGNVISQNPAAGSNVNVGSTVDLTVSTGKP